MSADLKILAKPERHEVTVTYLEQTTPPRAHAAARPARHVAIMRCEKPPVSFYRFIYNAVGADHKWVSRRYLGDEDLGALIHADNAVIYLLYVDGWPAGFAELDITNAKRPAIKFFGLVAETRHQGIGRWFFHEILGLVWADRPDAVRIDTCSMDDPSALRMYQRAGFNVIDQAKGIIEWYG